MASLPFQQIVGQDQVKSFLQGNLRTGKVAHGYLFCGPKGAGKSQMARALAQAVYCETMNDDGCGECPSCRKFAHGNSITFHEIKLLDDKKSISKDQITELKKHLSLKADNQQQKIYVIHDAHTLHPSAMSMLLKYLEEPSYNQLAILLTDNERGIPATVLSRLQLIKFTPPNIEQLLTTLERTEHDEELRRLAIMLGGGHEQALNLLTQAWFADYRTLVVELIQTSLKHPYSAVAVLQKHIGKMKAEGKKRLDLLAVMLEYMFRDCICHATGHSAQAVFTEHFDMLAQASIQRDIGYWVRCTELVLNLRKMRVVNVNWQMLLEQLFIQMKER
jgi:DNA polymerase-3 subunit delta'